jgi:ribonuclease BN (tRNA processing enzyme)
MNLTILGYSPAIQNPGAACSSYLISEDGTHLLVDAGHGSVGALRSVLEIGELAAVIISHMHPDHYFDLVPLTYGFKFGGLPSIPLFLPPEGGDVLGAFLEAAGLGDRFLADTFDVRTYSPSESFEVETVRIDTAPTRHYIQTNALRFTGRSPDRRIAYSADTGWSESVVELMRGASLALVEASIPEYHTANEEYGHMTPDLAGRMAREAGAERLIVTHYADMHAERALQDAKRSFGGPVHLARPGDRYTA